MENNLKIKPNLTIPAQELEITASRAGGPGGQHVNKTSTKITVRWNILASTALNEYQKAQLLEKLQSRLTEFGDLIVHYSASRSQLQNKTAALNNLAQIIRQGLTVNKKRIPTKISKNAKLARRQNKTKHSLIKKSRQNKHQD
jgi:ribosome-associated protein